MGLYSENTRVCAEWQWNAWECVTGLHDPQSRECNPVTPVECISLSFCTHLCVLALITYILCSNRIEMALVWWIYHKKVTHSYMFFKFTIYSIALLSHGETCQLKGHYMVTVWWMVLLLTCYDCDSMHQHCDIMRFEYVLWRLTIHEWVMNIHHQTWITQGGFINIIGSTSKQLGVCDKGQGNRIEMRWWFWSFFKFSFLSTPWWLFEDKWSLTPNHVYGSLYR